MISIMTLNTNEAPGCNRLRECLAPTGHATFDILCCQSMDRSLDGGEDLPHTLAQSLGLTSSCFAAGRQRHRMPGQRPKAASGLAILTGAGIWMLNSGSFPVPGEGEDWIAQFALIRKNGTSVMVLNLQLSPSAPIQLLQLRTLFSHPMLKERYGAVVLCADRPAALSAKELRALTSRSNYALHRRLLPASGQGTLCLFTAREEADIVTIHDTGTVQIVASPVPIQLPQAGLTLAFEVQRIPQTKKTRPYLPLSFREHWLGYKEKYPAFA